jgi:hypothetical protein
MSRPETPPETPSTIVYVTLIVGLIGSLYLCHKMGPSR